MTESNTVPINVGGEKQSLITHEHGVIEHENSLGSQGHNRMKDHVHLQTNLQAFINIIKANVGSGILGMPFAFQQSGLVLGVLGVFLVVVLATRCIISLVKCKRSVTMQTGKDSTYADVAFHCFGRYGVYATNFCLVFTQLGFCCAYLVFIGQNLHNLAPRLSPTVYVIIVLAALIPISWLPSLRSLAWTSLFAEAALLFGMAVVFYYDGVNMNSVDIHDNIKNWEFFTFPFFFGICVYSYEGIGLVLPIEDSMQHPKWYERLVYLAMLVITILTLAFGVLGYLAFPVNVEAVITLNLPDNALTAIVKVALCLALLFTYPVQMFPVSQLVDRRLFHLPMDEEIPHRPLVHDTPSEEVQTGRTRGPVNLCPRISLPVQQKIYRTLICCATALLAIAIPHFDLFVSLVGSFGSAFLAFILPTAFHLKMFAKKISATELLSDIVILVIGILGAVISTAVTLVALVKALEQNPF